MGTGRNNSQRAVRVALVLSTIVVIVAACGGGTTSATPFTTASAPVASATVPPVTASPGAELVVGGDRPVRVSVPPSYDANEPAPLVILLHGYTSSGAEVASYFGLSPEADARGFVVAYPDGTLDKDDNPFWNATDACCNFYGSDVDDVGYLTNVIDEIESNVAIDPKRVAIVGHSNGGFMSYRMACERADRIAAIVSLAGATFADPAQCAPSEPVSVAQIHGRLDDTILYEGGSTSRTYPGAETTAGTWATYDGCDATPLTLPGKLDIDAKEADGDDPAEATVTEWSGCDGGVNVQLWTMPHGGHVPELSSAFPEAVMDFLASHPKP